MTKDKTKTDPTECVTPAADSPHAEPIDPAERKRLERLAGIECYERKSQHTRIRRSPSSAK